MIYGIGSDIVDIARIRKILQQHGARFIQRCFTPAEQAQAQQRTDDHAIAAFYAKRFAAKEACAKALGTGFRNGLYLRDIGVVTTAYGRPTLSLTGIAAQQLTGLMQNGHSPMLHLSLSDTNTLAQAFVVIEGY